MRNTTRLAQIQVAVQAHAVSISRHRNLRFKQPLYLNFQLLLLMLVMLMLTGCSTVKDYVMPSGVKLDWESVTLSVAAGANRD